MTQKRSFDEYRVSDEFWERIQTVLPKYSPPSPKGGRPRKNLRRVVDGLFYCLRTGCQWKAIPPELCPGSTAHDDFQDGVNQGVFEELWALALEEYDELKGLDWEWQSADGAMTKAPLGGSNTGKNPTDRGKSGTKRSVLTDANGIPVGAAVGGANVPDKTLLKPTLEHSETISPDVPNDVEENLCLDKGYDYPDIPELVEDIYSYTAHIRSRGEEARELRKEAGEKARRWVAERVHSWLNRFRRILVRWEKKTENYFALLEFACAYITLQQAEVFG
jgi:putative transposase